MFAKVKSTLFKKSLTTNRCLFELTFYASEHVPIYHQWLQNPEIQHLTETFDVGTLEEEYTQYKLYSQDPHRLTLIIIFNSMPIGDLSLFQDMTDPESFEVSLMIAEVKYRRQGFAKASLRYVLEYLLPVNSRVQAKVDLNNQPSLQLFESLGFLNTDYSPTFSQITLTFVTKSLHSLLPSFDKA